MFQEPESLLDEFVCLIKNDNVNLYALSRARDRELDGIYRMRLFNVTTAKHC